MDALFSPFCFPNTPLIPELSLCQPCMQIPRFNRHDSEGLGMTAGGYNYCQNALRRDDTSLGGGVFADRLQGVRNVCVREIARALCGMESNVIEA